MPNDNPWLLIPDSTPDSYLQGIRDSCGNVRVSTLAIEQRVPAWSRVAGALARRFVSYARYVRMRPLLEAGPSLLVDGQPFAGLRPGIGILLANWAFDSRTASRVIDNLPDVRWIHSTVTGVDHFDLALLGRRGITLTTPRSIHARRIAEFVIALVAADTKNLAEHIEATRRRRARFISSREFAGTTLGIVGFGAIGRAVAQLAVANRFRVLAHQRQTTGGAPAPADIEVTPDLGHVLREADVLVLALPLTGQTRGLIDATAFGHMKRDAMLVNVGRGETIVEADLINAVRRRMLRKVCLDVVQDTVTGRPLFALPANHPFYGLDAILFTGYSSSESKNSGTDLLHDFLENLRRYCAGAELRNQVDLTSGY